MSKHFVRITLLSVIIAVALVASMGAGTAHAASYIRPCGRRPAPRFPRTARTTGSDMT